MTVDIRSAMASDAGKISLLLQNVQNLHATLYPAIFRSIEQDSLTEQVMQLIADPTLHVRLAVSEGEIAGYAVFRSDGCESSALIHSHRYLFLQQIAVDPDFRRKGIATALLDDFKACAAGMGITELRLDVWGANADARACFEKAGFATYNHRMKANI